MIIIIMKDYYKILEVSNECSPEDVKKSYRKLALKYHPDKNNGDDTRFKELAEAYEVLSDDNKRRQYDYNCSHGINYSIFGHQFMNANDLFNEIFKQSDMDMMSPFMDINPHNMFNDLLSPDFVADNCNLSTSISSSTIIQNGKKIVRTTIVENGISKTEEKIYDFIDKKNGYINNV